jgi:AmmeMemoRadiSam system protein A
MMYGFVKAVPCRTSESRAGVLTGSPPSAPMVPYRWSSVTMKTTLGLLAGTGAARTPRESAAAAAPAPTDPALTAPGAAFVTLTRARSLRGCIGYIRAIQPLAECVAHCAVAAATGDPRFPPVTAEELPHLALEISVLSPLVPIQDPTQVQVGVHGLYISRGGRHGLLLPQVATEYGWDRETFLRQTCRKAGLPDDAWRHGAEIQVFTVDHFTDGLPLDPPAR